MIAHDPEDQQKDEEGKDVHEKDDAFRQWQMLRKELAGRLGVSMCSEDATFTDTLTILKPTANATKQYKSKVVCHRRETSASGCTRSTIVWIMPPSCTQHEGTPAIQPRQQHQPTT